MESVITDQGIVRRFRRVPEAVPAARAFVRRWLPASPAAEGLVLGAAEAMNNAVDHAHGDRFAVAVGLDGTAGTVTVTDAGPGFAVPERPAMPGALEVGHRGLALVHVLVDDVDIATGPGGTAVTLTSDLRLPARDDRAAAEVA